MLKWLKKHFIPHHNNDHRPHILRDQGTQSIIIFVILIEMILFLSPVLGRVNIGLAAVLPAVMTDLANNERKSQNLTTLAENPLLDNAAQAKAVDMATKGYFAHVSPEGRNPWYWLDLVGYRYQHAGENLAINFIDSEDVVRAWMNSPTHRANIVKGNYSEVGTGVATGFYEGKEAIFVVQVYGDPLPKINVQNPLQQPKIPVKTKTPKAKQAPGRVVKKENIVVLGAEATTTPADSVIVLPPPPPPAEPAIWQRAAASPRNTTNLFLNAAFGFVALSLFLYVLIRARNHHLDLLVNGAMALVVILGFLIINLYISGHNTIVLNPIHYSNDSVIR